MFDWMVRKSLFVNFGTEVIFFISSLKFKLKFVQEKWKVFVKIYSDFYKEKTI